MAGRCHRPRETILRRKRVTRRFWHLPASHPRVNFHLSITALQLFQWAVENCELRPDNPWTKEDEAEERRRATTALLEECEHHPMLEPWVLIYVDTRMRVNSEPPWLFWEDVD